MTKEEFELLINLVGKMITYRTSPTDDNRKDYLDEYAYVECMLCERDFGEPTDD